MKLRKLPIGEMDLEIAEAGAGGQPLLLLHGFTGAKEDFTDWLDPLADRGWHAVAPDHGATARAVRRRRSRRTRSPRSPTMCSGWPTQLGLGPASSCSATRWAA